MVGRGQLGLRMLSNSELFTSTCSSDGGGPQGQSQGQEEIIRRKIGVTMRTLLTFQLEDGGLDR